MDDIQFVWVICFRQQLKTSETQKIEC